MAESEVKIVIKTDASGAITGIRTAKESLEGLGKGAQKGVDDANKAFKTLGIESSATMRKQMVDAQKSYETIKQSAQSTSDDIIRAEQARTRTIAELNAKLTAQTTQSVKGMAQPAGADSLISSMRNILVAVGAVTVAYKGLQILMSVPMKGLDFLKEMETAKLGIASVIASTQELVTQDGRRLQGQDKLAASQKITADLMKKLQIAGLETVATTQELVTGFQAMVGPATAAGMTLEQAKDITVQMVQAMGALGIHMNELSSEGRSLLDGSINTMQDRLAGALGITNDMVAKWKTQGTLFKELSGRLEMFKIAGAEAANTWQGLTSNLKEAAAFVGSSFTGHIFDGAKEGFQSLINLMVNTKSFSLGRDIEQFVRLLDELGADIGRGLADSMRTFVGLIKSANDYVRQNQAELLAVWESVKKVAEQFILIVENVASLTAGIIGASTVLAPIQFMFTFISTTLATISDLFGYIKLGVMVIGTLILNYWLSALSVIAQKLGSLAGFISKDLGDTIKGFAKDLGGAGKGLADETNKAAMALGSNLSPATKRALDSTSGVKKEMAGVKNETYQTTGGVKQLTAEMERLGIVINKQGTVIEKNNERYDKLVKNLQSGLSQKTMEIEVSFKGIDPGGTDKNSQALYNQLLTARRAYYKQLTDTVIHGTDEQLKVIQAQAAKVEKELKDQILAEDRLRQEAAKKSVAIANDPKMNGQQKAAKAAALDEEIKKQQENVEKTKALQADLLRAAIQTAQKRKEAVMQALEETLQKERQYAAEVKKLEDEKQAHKYKVWTNIQELDRQSMTDSAANADRVKQANLLMYASFKAYRQDDFNSTKQYAGDAAKTYMDLATKAAQAMKDAQARGDWATYRAQQLEMSQWKEKYLEAEYMITRAIEAEKAIAEAKWRQEQENAKALIEAMKKLDETVESFAERLKGLSKEKKATIIFEESGLDAILKRFNEIKDKSVTVTITEVTQQAKRWGGEVYGYARGGNLPGYGGGDSVSAMLEPGEFVVRKEAVKRYGAGFLYALNDMRLSADEFFDRFASSDTRPSRTPPPPAFPRAAFSSGGEVTPTASPENFGTIALQVGTKSFKVYTTKGVAKELNKEIKRSRMVGHQ
jgi:hypothetical protein